MIIRYRTMVVTIAVLILTLLVFIPCSIYGQSFEDFTTYTEVDATGVISIVSNTVTLSSVPRDQDHLVYEDYGIDGISGSNTYEFEFNQTGGDSTGIIIVWGVTHGICSPAGDYAPCSDDVLSVFSYGAPHIRIREKCDADNGYGTSIGINRNTVYYITVITDHNNETVTLEVYSDAGRTTHVSGSPDTYTTGVGTCALYPLPDWKWRYFHVAGGMDDDQTDVLSGTVSNYCLGSGCVEATEVIINTNTNPVNGLFLGGVW